VGTWKRAFPVALVPAVNVSRLSLEARLLPRRLCMKASLHAIWRDAPDAQLLGCSGIEPVAKLGCAGDRRPICRTSRHEP
jgi:hypothetical protein